MDLQTITSLIQSGALALIAYNQFRTARTTHSHSLDLIQLRAALWAHTGIDPMATPGGTPGGGRPRYGTDGPEDRPDWPGVNR